MVRLDDQSLPQIIVDFPAVATGQGRQAQKVSSDGSDKISTTKGIPFATNCGLSCALVCSDLGSALCFKLSIRQRTFVFWKHRSPPTHFALNHAKSGEDNKVARESQSLHQATRSTWCSDMAGREPRCVSLRVQKRRIKIAFAPCSIVPLSRSCFRRVEGATPSESRRRLR